jgi:hypothetical protein
LELNHVGGGWAAIHHAGGQIEKFDGASITEADDAGSIDDHQAEVHVVERGCQPGGSRLERVSFLMDNGRVSAKVPQFPKQRNLPGYRPA